MKKNVVGLQTKNNFSGLFLSKNLKIKREQNQLGSPYTLMQKMRKYEAPHCQTAAIVLPISSHHKATQATTVDVRISPESGRKTEESYILQSNSNAHQLIRMNV